MPVKTSTSKSVAKPVARSAGKPAAKSAAKTAAKPRRAAITTSSAAKAVAAPAVTAKRASTKKAVVPKPRRAPPVALERDPSAVLAALLANGVADKGAEDIRVLALAVGHHAFDFVVIASARSDRQCHAAAEECRQFCKQRNYAHRGGVEGTTGWLLFDAYAVVVHVFLAEERTKYDLDHLWPDAHEVAWQPLIESANAVSPARLPTRVPKRAARLKSRGLDHTYDGVEA